jgi:hypothetical protein
MAIRGEVMAAGTIIFDSLLILDITSLSFQSGVLRAIARGEITFIPQGVIPYAVYGHDASLITVGRCDFDALRHGIVLHQGDHVVMDLDLDLTTMGVAR